MKALYYIGSLGIFMWLGMLTEKWVGTPIDYYKLFAFAFIGVSLVSIRDYCIRKLRNE